MRSSDSDDSSDDNINLKELQSRLHQAASLNINYDCTMSDDSDKDITWKPSKQDLVSSSDESDSFYERHDHNQKHTLLDSKESTDQIDDVEMIVASIIEDYIIRPIINKTDNVAKMIGSLIEDFIISPVFATTDLLANKSRKKTKV